MYYIPACSCYPPGTITAGVISCNPQTGDCPCQPNVRGRQCNQCEEGYWNLDSGQGLCCYCVPIFSDEALFLRDNRSWT